MLFPYHISVETLERHKALYIEKKNARLPIIGVVLAIPNLIQICILRSNLRERI
jgi:hypothetical protein